MDLSTALQGGDLGDLAEQAGRRAARTRLLGRLLVAEPGPEEVALARALPSLAATFADTAALRADYQQALLSQVACYQSVFTGPDGQLGAVDAALVAIYRRCDLDWRSHRVPAGDHLGVQLLAYAHLCELEAEAWADDRPDLAGQVVETQRELLASHLGTWAPAATAALARTGTAYAAVARLCDDVLAAEAQLLRPAPEHPGMPPVTVETGGPQGGAGRIARRLLAPVRAGGYLFAADVAPLAAALETPWRPSDTRSRLRHVIDTALARHELDAVTAAFTPLVQAWHDHWLAARDAQPGARRTIETWRLRTEATLAWLARLGENDADADPATLVVGSPERMAAVLAALSAGGIAVTTEPAPPAVRAAVDVLVSVKTGAPERWEGDPPPGAAVRLDAAG